MKLSNFSKLSFGIGALGKDLCYAIISYFLMIYPKLVDCLEKCLICRHIRRFAD
jgi:Na+/melibiose symporter-like transporter